MELISAHDCSQIYTYHDRSQFMHNVIQDWLLFSLNYHLLGYIMHLLRLSMRSVNGHMYRLYVTIAAHIHTYLLCICIHIMQTCDFSMVSIYV